MIHASSKWLRTLRGEQGYIDADTYVGPESVAVAELAAGGHRRPGRCAASTGRSKRGVALVRPPGHHARPDHAMGFCLLNNVAIAAAHARARGLERVAIVDWDVHHGNGTQDAFFDDPQRPLRVDAPVPVLSGHRRGARDRRGRRQGLHGQRAADRGRRRRRLSRGLRARDPPGARGVSAAARARERRASTRRRAIRSPR